MNKLTLFHKHLEQNIQTCLNDFDILISQQDLAQDKSPLIEGLNKLETQLIEAHKGVFHQLRESYFGQQIDENTLIWALEYHHYGADSANEHSCYYAISKEALIYFVNRLDVGNIPFHEANQPKVCLNSELEPSDKRFKITTMLYHQMEHCKKEIRLNGTAYYYHEYDGCDW